MDGNQNARDWDRERALHVLVVEHDPEILSRTCARVIAEGCEVSTRRVPRGLPALVESLRPDLILLDVLTPGLDGQELFVLLARCRPSSLPAVVLHSKLSNQMLRTVLDLEDVLGVIQKTESDQEFSERFRSLVELLASGQRQNSLMPRTWLPATSGTHRIGAVVAEPDLSATVQAIGARRR
ncbi:MAG TPA: response regulator [Polyangiales bacterium]|nr:response regulator [Polyangiales bacterium]